MIAEKHKLFLSFLGDAETNSSKKSEKNAQKKHAHKETKEHVGGGAEAAG